MDDKRQYTTEEALEYLHISRGTFFKLLKRFNVKAANHNPILEVQYRLLFDKEDLDKIKYGRQPQREQDKPPPRQVA